MNAREAAVAINDLVRDYVGKDLFVGEGPYGEDLLDTEGGKALMEILRELEGPVRTAEAEFLRKLSFPYGSCVECGSVEAVYDMKLIDKVWYCSSHRP